MKTSTVEHDSEQGKIPHEACGPERGVPAMYNFNIELF